jgi:dephospho-CoA kinase
MLRVGLTGGIGAGKSTVARRLVELGATLVDADRVAREVVEPGTEGLRRVAEAFGPGVLDADGALDRPALAAVVFGDEDARRRLNGIVHPLVGARTAELVAAAPADGVLVQDIPLLVEGAMAPAFPLVVVVDAPEDVRVARLVADRGMSERDARARIAAQATPQARRAAADVLLDNSGDRDAVLAAVDRLWHGRLLPLEAAVRTGRPAGPGTDPVTEPDPTWAEQGERLAARVAHAAGAHAVRVDHIGATAVPGLAAPDRVDLLVGVAPGTAPGTAPELAAGLRAAGFLPGPDGGPLRSADPGRPAAAHLIEAGTVPHRRALLLRDWLRADAGARAEYRDAVQGLIGTRDDPAGPERDWCERVGDRADHWAETAGWRAPGHPIVEQPEPGPPQKL